MMNDDVIMRTIIEIPDDEVKALADVCRIQKISRAEAIRRALREMLAANANKERSEAFGAWKRPIDSRTFVDKLRGEWDR